MLWSVKWVSYLPKPFRGRKLFDFTPGFTVKLSPEAGEAVIGSIKLFLRFPSLGLAFRLPAYPPLKIGWRFFLEFNEFSLLKLGGNYALPEVGGSKFIEYPAGTLAGGAFKIDDSGEGFLRKEFWELLLQTP